MLINRKNSNNNSSCPSYSSFRGLSIGVLSAALCVGVSLSCISAGCYASADRALSRDGILDNESTLSNDSELNEAQAIKKGEAIVEKWDKCDYGFDDMMATYRLIQKDSDGSILERSLTLRMYEQTRYDNKGIKTSGDRSIVSFNSPADIAGTALLVYSNLEKNDDTWVYLPSLRRVKRISSENQSGNFAGTEFAYEDIASQEYYKFTYKWLRREACGIEGEQAVCDVIEQLPTYPNSGYSRQVAWYDDCRQRRIDYFDHKGELYKTQTFNNYKQYHGKHWRGHHNTMINHRNGRSSRLVIPEFEYRNGFVEGDFSSARLKFLR